MKRIQFDTTKVKDWMSFHQVFKTIMGFPTFYGANMDAWIDCMSYVDSPEAEMSQITIEKGDLLLLEISDTEDFKKRCPEQLSTLIECTAFVNRRHVEMDSSPVLSLTFL